MVNLLILLRSFSLTNKKYFLFFHTIRYLKSVQIYFRVSYFLRKRIRRFEYKLSIKSVSTKLLLEKSIYALTSYQDNGFIFLNKEHIFEKNIDWNMSLYGKLWTYNVTYFDYLQQKNMTQELGLKLVDNFIEQINSTKDGLEPFPISLRGMNWIKFLSKYKIKDLKIDNSLYAQYKILIDNLEYHLLGNHLLENGFSLLFGAYYFQDEKFYLKAKKILSKELEEQILKDGAHFELSPMYHQIMLFRVLDCINLLQNNDWKEQELLALLTHKAAIMLGWLHTMTYKNGDIPLLNDSTNNIAPTTEDLTKYALRLNIQKKLLALNDSGYRKVKNKRYELVMDVGNIGPDYIPGHAHSDTFNFELYIDGKPFIVDTGLSTYETNARRTLERSTASHNTVEVGGVEQTEVWGGFRVARRAKVIYLYENKNEIKATHDGYKRIGALHTRKFMTFDDSIIIEDHIKSSKDHRCIAYLHFYPGITPIIQGSNIIVDDICIRTGNATLKLENYLYAPEFNNIENAIMVVLTFKNTLKMDIQL